MNGSVASIETFSVVDGPGIRTVVFFNECHLRCIYCHNPEMWNKGINNISEDELVNKILRNKDYFGENGGVTFSGGEPLLHSKFLINVCKKLKEHDIHIALDTAGVGDNYIELLKYIDLIIFDIKHTTIEGYKKITKSLPDKSLEFIDTANKLNKKFWIRQVIVPTIMDNEGYIKSLNDYIKKHFKIENVLKVEFLPYHKLGREKYIKLSIPYSCENIPEMDKDECDKLYNKFMEFYLK